MRDLEVSFIRHEKIYRHDVQGKLNTSLTSPSNIVAMSLQPVIPSEVALQQRLRPLHRPSTASLSTLLLSSSQQPTATVPQLHCLKRGVHYRVQSNSVSERTFFAGLNRNIRATINRSATTYGVRISISDRLPTCPLIRRLNEGVQLTRTCNPCSLTTSIKTCR
jgi:hypothetical protein